MIFAAALMALAQVASAPPSAPGPGPAAPETAPPSDWSSLPSLPLLKLWQLRPQLSRYVRDEVVAGRCGAAVRDAAGGYVLRVPLAVRIGSEGQVQKTVPRAIGCPTVEQYASGLVSRLARGNLAARAGWFRATIVFSWRA